MILKKILILVFVLTTTSIVSQNKVCESPSELDIMMELNMIDKCYIENKSNDTTRPTRNRYVRTKSNPQLSRIKNLRSNSDKSEPNVVTMSAKKIKPAYIKFKNLTQTPILLTPKGTSNYKRNLKKALKHYVNENLVYPSGTKVEGRVWASFIIDTKGAVKNIVTSGPLNATLLETETERLIKALPNFIPGKLNGEYVNTKYLMTVDFKLD